jgi:hypothetical protein
MRRHGHRFQFINIQHHTTLRGIDARAVSHKCHEFAIEVSRPQATIQGST